jgi:hypothetical protein
VGRVWPRHGHRGRPLNSVVRLHMNQVWLTATGILLSASVAAGQAPQGMTMFNRTCPAPTLLPKLEVSYQGCVRKQQSACDDFVVVFRDLLAEFDCQRPFDATPAANYTVPAIWLAGEPSLDKYMSLLSKLTSKSAKKLFASPEFRAVLDGDFAEIYRKRSEVAERKLKEK